MVDAFQSGAAPAQTLVDARSQALQGTLGESRGISWNLGESRGISVLDARSQAGLYG